MSIRCSRIHEQVSSYRKCIVQCSLEYSIRGDVTIVATAVDVIIVKGCRISVNPVVAQVVCYNMAQVVGYFVGFVMVLFVVWCL